MENIQNLQTLAHSMSGKIEVVLFDLDGTLRYNRPLPDKVLYDYLVTLGVEDGQEKRRRAARWAHYSWANSPDLAEDKQAYPEDERFWNKYIQRSLEAFDCFPECVQKLTPKIYRFMQDEYKPEDHLYPDVPDTLEVLKDAGYRLGVISNREQPCQEYVEGLGIMTYFDLALVAGEVGAWKPDPQIFHQALDRLDVLPEQAIYVGDNYYADVIGARRASVQPVLIDPLGVFPDADCPVIRAIGDLQKLIRVDKDSLDSLV